MTSLRRTCVKGSYSIKRGEYFDVTGSHVMCACATECRQWLRMSGPPDVYTQLSSAPSSSSGHNTGTRHRRHLTLAPATELRWHGPGCPDHGGWCEWRSEMMRWWWEQKLNEWMQLLVKVNHYPTGMQCGSWHNISKATFNEQQFRIIIQVEHNYQTRKCCRIIPPY